jgi:hypothetical protein
LQKTILHIIFSTIALLACVVVACAQEQIYVKPDKSSLVPGEPVMLNITITGEKALLPIVPDTLGRFEVLRKSDVKHTSSENKILSTQTVVITGFDTGRWRVPGIAINEFPGIQSPHFDLLVNKMPADSLKEYGNLKELLSLTPPPQWPYLAALLLATLASAFGAWYYWRRVLRKVQVAAPAAKNTELGSLLVQLKDEWLANKLTGKEFADRLFGITCMHFAQQGIPVRSKTGEELITDTRTLLDAGTWQGLAGSVRLCNALRFGRFEADKNEGLAALQAIEELVLKVPDH